MEEFVALTDPKLSIFTGEEEEMDSYDERPTHKITQFRCVNYEYCRQKEVQYCNSDLLLLILYNQKLITSFFDR